MGFLDEKSRSQPLRTATIAAIGITLIWLILAWTGSAKREELGQSAVYALAIAMAAGGLAGLVHRFAIIGKFSTRVRRWTALALPLVIVFSLAFASYFRVREENLGGFLEILIMGAVGAFALLLAASLAMQLLPFMRSWKGVAGFAGAVAALIAMSAVLLPSGARLDREYNALARTGFISCDNALTEAERRALAIADFELANGRTADGMLDDTELAELEALPAKASWRVGSSPDADFTGLGRALAHACAASGALVIELEAGRHLADFNALNFNPEDLFGWRDADSDNDGRSVTIRGQGAESTQLDTNQTLFMGDNDKLESLTVRHIGEFRDSIVEVRGSGAAFTDVVFNTGDIGRPDYVVRIDAGLGGDASFQRVRLGGAQRAAMHIAAHGDAPPTEAMTLLLSDVSFTEGSSEAIVAEGEAEMRLMGVTTAENGVSLLGNSRATIVGGAFNGTAYPALYLGDNAQASVDGARFSLGGDAYCIYAEGDSVLDLRNSDFSRCNDPARYSIMVDGNANATFADNSALERSAINTPSEKVSLAYSEVPRTVEARWPAAISAAGSLAARTGRGGTQSLARSQAHMEWLLYNYWNALSSEATSCAFVASSNRGRVSVSNFSGGMCLLFESSCEYTRELQQDILDEQEQCWNEMATAFNRIHARAIAHQDSCPRLNDALGAYSRWWYPEALDASSVVNEDPVGRTSRFNDRAGQRFVEVITTNRC